MKKERLYLKRNEYNNYRVTEELAKIVKSHNGCEVDSWPFIFEKTEYTITDRTVYNKINEKRDCIILSKRFLEDPEEDATTQKLKEHAKKQIEEYTKEIEDLTKIADVETTTTTHANYLHFYYDGYIYYMQLNENPFFEHYFTKAKCYYDPDKKQYIEDFKHYATKVNIDFYIDECFNKLTDEEIKERAKLLWQVLTSMKESDIVTKRQRVQNYYNSNYHYEYIKEKNGPNNGRYVRI